MAAVPWPVAGRGCARCRGVCGLVYAVAHVPVGTACGDVHGVTPRLPKSVPEWRRSHSDARRRPGNFGQRSASSGVRMNAASMAENSSMKTPLTASRSKRRRPPGTASWAANAASGRRRCCARTTRDRRTGRPLHRARTLPVPGVLEEPARRADREAAVPAGALSRPHRRAPTRKWRRFSEDRRTAVRWRRLALDRVCPRRAVCCRPAAGRRSPWQDGARVARLPDSPANMTAGARRLVPNGADNRTGALMANAPVCFAGGP